MRDRRTSERQSETIDATITEGLTGPIRRVRILNLSTRGAEIETEGEGIDDADLSIRIGSDGAIRKARIAWRRMERFGLVFEALPGDEEAETAQASAENDRKALHDVVTKSRVPAPRYAGFSGSGRGSSNVVPAGAVSARMVMAAWRPPSLSEYLLRDIVKSAGRRASQ